MDVSSLIVPASLILLYSSTSKSSHSSSQLRLRLRLNEEFQRNGYVLLRKFLSQRQVEEIKCELCRFVERVIPTLPEGQVFYENKDDLTTLKQIQKMQMCVDIRPLCNFCVIACKYNDA